MSTGLVALHKLIRSTISMNPHKLPQVIQRYYSKDMNKNIDNNKFNLIEANELRFPLPYGQLAAKEWGNTFEIVFKIQYFCFWFKKIKIFLIYLKGTKMEILYWPFTAGMSTILYNIIEE